jgi:hypothetical protein
MVVVVVVGWRERGVDAEGVDAVGGCSGCQWGGGEGSAVQCSVVRGGRGEGARWAGKSLP